MTEVVEKYKEHLINAINKANNRSSKLVDELFNIQGMTGILTKHFYNNLLDMDDVRYLEIGCYKGSSTCAAMYDNSANLTCIDSWHDFLLNELHNGVDKNEPIQEFITNVRKYKGKNDLVFYNEDSFAIDTNKLGKYNIYLYDGDHTYESQYKALTYYINNMDDIFIYVVDDWNDEPVRRGTFDAIRDLGLTNLWEHEVRLTYDNKHTPSELAHKTWWNGCYMCVLSRSRSGEP
jgi:hypothetical protein